MTKFDLFGPTWGTRMLEEGKIGGLCDLAEHVGADIREGDTAPGVIARIQRRVYKDTSCGCGLSFNSTSPGLLAQSVLVWGACEGIDWVFKLRTFQMGDTCAAWDACVAAAEEEGELAWNITHGCEACGEPGENGYRKVREDCQNCGGTGCVI